LAITLFFLVKYTLATQRQVKTSEQQFRLSIEQQRGTVMPILLLEFDWYQDGQAEHLPVLRNVGVGPALDVLMHPLKISESETIRFERIPVVRHEGADPVQIRAFQFKGEQFYQNINRASQLAKYLLPPNSTGSSREGTPDVNEFSTLIWDLRIEFNHLMGYRRTAQYEVRADYGMARVRVFPAKQI